MTNDINMTPATISELAEQYMGMAMEFKAMVAECATAEAVEALRPEGQAIINRVDALKWYAIEQHKPEFYDAKMACIRVELTVEHIIEGRLYRIECGR